MIPFRPRSRLVVAAVAAAALSALAAASEAQAPPPGGAGAGGGMNPQQFEARCKMVFMRADIDRDGRITRQEWDQSAKRIRSWLEAHGKQLPGTPDKTFNMLDANHDGVVTPLEIDAACARLAAKRAPAAQ